MRDVSFCPFIGNCSLAAISDRDSLIHAASNSRPPFPHLCTESCPAPAALAAVAGHYFSVSAYNLTFKSPYHGKAENDIS